MFDLLQGKNHALVAGRRSNTCLVTVYPKVNNAVDETVKRESSWTRKYSPTCDAQSIVDLAVTSIGLEKDTDIHQISCILDDSQATYSYHVK